MSENNRYNSKRASKDNLKKALKAIQKASSELDIPSSTKNQGINLYRQYLQATKEDKLFGNKVENIAVTCLYLACKIEEVPVSYDEVSEKVGIDAKTLKRRAKKVRKRLGLDDEAFLNVDHYIEGYAEEIGLEEEGVERALEIAEMCSEEGVNSGKSPRGMASAILYCVCLEKNVDVRQSDIAEVSDVTVVTIRNRHHEVKELIKNRRETPNDLGEAIEYLIDEMGCGNEIRKRVYSRKENLTQNFEQQTLEGLEDSEYVEGEDYDVDNIDSVLAAAGLVYLVSNNSNVNANIKGLKILTDKTSPEIKEAAGVVKDTTYTYLD